MLDFKDAPYAYYPPRPHPLFIGLFRLYNRYLYLPSRVNWIKKIEIVNPEVFREIQQKPDARFLFTPNHPTHSDPSIMMDVQWQLGVRSLFMAAYDGFQKSRIQATIMQRAGAFSVDREGQDTRAFKEAQQVLLKGDYALTIFPEGNVYLRNEKVTPFLEGAAYIALRAQKQLGPEKTLYVIPVAIKATHSTFCQKKVIERIHQVAREAGMPVEEKSDWLAVLKKSGLRILANTLEEQGLLPRLKAEGDLTPLLASAVEHLIESLENEMDLSGGAENDLLGRVRGIRRKVHQLRLKADEETDMTQVAAWGERAMLAFRILHYLGSYLEESPSLDRFYETADRLLEDLSRTLLPPLGLRQVFVQLGNPIPLHEWLYEYQASSRETIQKLTRQLENEVQWGIDQICANNPYPGGQRFADLK